MILSNSQYVSMCQKILSNKSWYRTIPRTLIDRFQADFYEIVDLSYLNRVLTKNQWGFVCTPFPHIPTFYSLPKLHKHVTSPPGRPIVSRNGSLTENLSHLVDEHLRPHVISLPSYLQDTIYLLQIIEGVSVFLSALLVAIDVEALYSSIPHNLSIACIRRVLSQRTCHDWQFQLYFRIS